MEIGDCPSLFWFQQWQQLEVNLLKQLAVQLGVAIQQTELHQQAQTEQIARQEAEAKLQASEQFLRSIYDGAANSIFVIDVLPSGEFRFAGLNPAHEQLIGIRSEELQGKSPEQVLPPVDAAAVSANYAKCVQAETTISYEECLPFQGKDSWWLTTLTPLFDEQSQIYRLIGTSINITQRKLTEAALRISEATNRALLEAIPDLIIRMTRDGTYIDFIPAGDFKILMPSPDMRGKNLYEVMPLEIAQQRMHYVELALSTGKTQIYEFQLLLDGEIYTQEARIVASGEDEVLVIVRDISDRKRMEAALRESEAQFRTLVANIPGVVYRCAHAQEWQGMFISDAIENIFGYPASDFAHSGTRTFTSIIYSEDVERVEQILEAALQKRQDFRLEYQIVHANGSLRWVSEKGQGMFDEQGELLWVDGVIFDITDRKQAEQERDRLFQQIEQQNETLEAQVQERTTELMQANEQLQQEVAERKQAEEALRHSEEKFRQMAENIQSVFWMTNLDLTQIIYVSPAYELIWGRPCAELYASPKSWRNAIHPEDRDRMIAARFRENRGEYDEEYRIIRPDGEIRWIRDRGFPIQNEAGEIYRLVGVAEDISDQKLAQEALRESEARFRRLFESNIVGVIFGDFNGSITDANDVFLQMVGYTREDLLNGKVRWNEMTLPYRHLDQQAMEQFKTTRVRVPQEKEYIRKDGSRVPVLIGGALLDGFDDQAIAFVLDISDRKRMEEALRESEKHFRQMFQDASIGIALADFQTNRFIQVNPAYSQLLGYSASEITSLTFDEITHPDDLPQNLHYFEQINQGQIDSYRLEKRYLKKNGEFMWAHLTVTVLRNPDGKPKFTLAMIEDITERKQAEDKIKASLLEKETLLKEIHHRVKNNLQIISSLLRLQSRQLRDQQTLEHFKESQNRVQAMALIHEKLYQSSNLAQIDFQEYIRTLVQELFRSYDVHRRAITLKLNVTPVSLAIDTAIPCGLIINELVSNSLKYAFPDNREGEICINLQESDKGQFILSISDNGVGLAEYLDFRNTSSLGLQLVCRLTKQLEGSIELNAKQGTEFSITFANLKYH